MRYEIDIYGVLVPALLLWLIVAYVLSALSAPADAALRPLPAGLAPRAVRFRHFRLPARRRRLSLGVSVMKGNFAWLGRVALTVIAVVAALGVGRELWVYYMERALDPRRPGARRRRAGRARRLRLRHRRAGQGQPEGPSRRCAVPDRPRAVCAGAAAGRRGRSRAIGHAGSGQCRSEALQRADDRCRVAAEAGAGAGDPAPGQGGLRSGGCRPRGRPAQSRSQRGARVRSTA